MGKTTVDLSMSLDGFITASNQTAEEPLGEGAEQHLLGWAFGADLTNRRLVQRYHDGVGAFICGRRTYDHSLPWWGADGPSGVARRPVFVVTHRTPAEDPPGSVYRFVTDGIEGALARARAAAGDKDVSVMGGANLSRQYLAAGLVDEIGIHLVPVLFGAGIRMFGHIHNRHTRLELVDALETASAVHLRYRIVT
jgi:dihydrofolate reductase